MVWGAGLPCRPSRPARFFFLRGPVRILMAPEAPAASGLHPYIDCAGRDAFALRVNQASLVAQLRGK